MRTRTLVCLALLLTIVFTFDAMAQGRGGQGRGRQGRGGQRGMRGRSTAGSTGQMNQTCPMQANGGGMGQCARGGQGRGGQGRGGQGRGGQGRGGQGGLGQGRGGNCYLDFDTPTGPLAQQDAPHILLLREEEKLARDVYLTLSKKWDVRVFRNIAQAESRHMSAMKMLVNRYGLKDPVTDDTVGTFTSPKFTKLYQELVASGSQSLADAYRVGEKIEELDIKDLKDSMTTVENADVRRVYQNLLRASENHLRAFTANL